MNVFKQIYEKMNAALKGKINGNNLKLCTKNKKYCRLIQLVAILIDILVLFSLISVLIEESCFRILTNSGVLSNISRLFITPLNPKASIKIQKLIRQTHLHQSPCAIAKMRNFEPSKT